MSATPKAGDQFLCVCCKEPADTQQASYDDQYAGPVCEDCRVQTKAAVAWLKHAGISRPVTMGDVTPHNCNRLKNL